MGKKEKKGIKQLIKAEMRELQQEENRLHKRRRALMAACQHRDGKDFAIEYEKKGQVRCRHCGARFSLTTQNLDEIRKSTHQLNSALQQVRILADSEDDAKLIADLGKLSADIIAINDIYKRHLDRYGKGNNNDKKKEKKRHDDDYGGYSGVIDIMEGAIPKKKKKK